MSGKEVVAESVREDETMNVALWKQDTQTGGEVVVIQPLTTVFEFIGTDGEEKEIHNAFAVADVESLPESAGLTAEEEVFIEDGGRVYVSMRVLQLGMLSDSIDRIRHRFREGDTQCFYRNVVADDVKDAEGEER